MLLKPVEGLPLHKMLQMTGPFTPIFTRLIISQVGMIMNSFHKQGYVYRDIKASNFMIGCKGQVTMIDLGKAKYVPGGWTFTVCGTAHSMAPEVYDGQGYGKAVDYYAFGVLIY